MAQPGVNLYKIGNQLRRSHQLPKPWVRGLCGLIEEGKRLALIHNGVQRRRGVV